MNEDVESLKLVVGRVEHGQTGALVKAIQGTKAVIGYV